MDTKVIFLLLLQVTLGFVVYKTRKRRAFSNLFLFFFTVLLLLLVTELFYRIFWHQKKIISTVNTFYNKDSLTGFKWKDTGRLKAVEYFVGGDTIYNTYYTILADTIEHETNYPFRKGYKSNSGSRETVFLGCSYTFGECLSDEQTLPYQYGELTGTSAVNRGCNGYGIHQVYQFFKLKYAGQDNHNRVFVYSFSPDHFVRANNIYRWNIAGPYFIISGDSLIDKGPLFKFKKVKGLRLAYYASFLGTFTFIKDNIERISANRAVKELNEKDIAPCYLMLRKMAEIIQQTGGKFIILNWDSGYSKNKRSKIWNQDNINRKLAEEVTPAGGIVLPVSPVIDFSNPLYFVPDDGHPNALANKIIAEYLAKNVKTEK